VEALDTLFGGQPEPPAPVVLVTAAVALGAVSIDRVWRIARNVVTIAHEGGHALAALLTRRRLTGIRLHSDTSGVTVSVGRPTGPGMVLTTAAGYPAPSLLGLGGVALLATDHVTVLLWAAAVLLAGMLVMIRNVYGAATVLVVGGAVVAVSLLAPADAQSAFAYLGTWFLLLGGVRPVGELQAKRGRGRAPYSDADQLGHLTHVPGLLWVLLFGAISLAALGIGANFLLR
jgi:hypothetical protein